MNLSHRPTELEDLRPCARLLQGADLYDEQTLSRLPEIWSKLLINGCAVSEVVQDEDRPLDERIVAFGMTVFVTDAFVQRTKACYSPSISCQVFKSASDRDTPILSRTAIRIANSGEGLNVLVLANGFAKLFWEDTEGLSILQQSMASFVAAHMGFNIKEHLMECYDAHFADINTAVGFRIRSDPYSMLNSPSRSPIPSNRLAYLIGLTREEALTTPGCRAVPMFLYTKPRFFFRPGEQELLARALMGGTNEEIADSLSISLSAVKKRWEAIYARVESANSELFWPVKSRKFVEPTRGAQKKDVLLSYLRRHSEELRPAVPPKNTEPLSPDGGERTAHPLHR